MFDGVIKLGRDVAAFATNLADALVYFVNLLPDPGDLIDALDIGGLLDADDGLCLAPACPGSFHINSGKEENIVPGETEAISILASNTHRIAHAYRIPPTQRARIAHACVSRHRARHRPHTRPLCGVLLCGRRAPRCPFASRLAMLRSILTACVMRWSTSF